MAQERKTSGRRDAAGGPIPLELPPDRTFVLHLDTLRDRVFTDCANPGRCDAIRGGPGNDVIIGGTEQGTPSNSDIMFGDDGDDVNLWRGGDGSEAFIGGRGKDALVFGNIDRDDSNVPMLSPATGRHKKTGLPTADVTGQGGFCTLEDVRDQKLGYEFLIRFFARATGNLAVTVRTAEVEQMFCTSQAGGAITFADLTSANPSFVEVSLDEVAKLNPLVGQIIR